MAADFQEIYYFKSVLGDKKKWLKWILTITCLVLSIFIVKEQCNKYKSGNTTISIDKQYNDALELPQVTICMDRPYKKDVLEEYGLAQRFFLSPNSSYGNKTFPNLTTLWNEATYSEEELDISWQLYDRKIKFLKMLLELQEQLIIFRRNE